MAKTLRQQAVDALIDKFGGNISVGELAQEAIEGLPFGAFADEKSHKSDCRSNDEPAYPKGPCTCEPGLELVISDTESPVRFRHYMVNSRTATCWQGTLLTEIVKHYCGAWPTEKEDSSGDQTFEFKTPAEIVDRSVEIVNATMDAMKRNGWMVPIPPMEELRTDGGNVGFTATAKRDV